MIKDYTTISIKIDNFKVYDYDRIKRLAEVHGVPDRASVRIVTSGLGTMITFEWADETYPRYKEKFQPKAKPVKPISQWKNYHLR